MNPIPIRRRLPLKIKGQLKGLHTIPSGVDYSRFSEWPLAVDLLNLKDGDRVLDVGSGDNSLFPLMLGTAAATDLTVLDYSDPLTNLRLWHTQGGKKGWLKSDISFCQGDIRNLQFPDASFDAVSCISTMEHIPDEKIASEELARVVKPGGKVVITVPFCAQCHDEYKADHVYERICPGELVFFQRFYSFDSPPKILDVPTLETVSEIYLGERLSPYFWKNDCERLHQAGKVVLRERKKNYFQYQMQRFMSLPASLLFTRAMDRKKAEANTSCLFAAVFLLQKNKHSA